MEQYFAYGDRETDYLRQRDSKLAEAIERLGRPRRRVMPDLFQALTWSILGQQISTKACEAVWSRMLAGLGEVMPASVMEESVASLQKFGTSFRKAGYIHSIAEQIATGAFARRDLMAHLRSRAHRAAVPSHFPSIKFGEKREYWRNVLHLQYKYRKSWKPE